MNKHIELVKKWLADKDSVSLKEIKENNNAAWHAAAEAATAEAAYAAYAAYAADAGYAKGDAVYADAEYWVQEYEKMTDE